MNFTNFTSYITLWVTLGEDAPQTLDGKRILFEESFKVVSVSSFVEKCIQTEGLEESMAMGCEVR